MNFFSSPSWKLTNRQRAEIQLEALLTDPEISLPVYIRRITENLPDDLLSIEQVSKLLNTQPFIIERLVHALSSPSEPRVPVKTLQKIEVQKLTRVLNGTVDVRALLFFKMLDAKHDEIITRNGLRQFYEQYLKALKTFDSERLEEFIQVLSTKFHLDEVSLIRK